jgi:hypothetical protein
VIVVAIWLLLLFVNLFDCFGNETSALVDKQPGTQFCGNTLVHRLDGEGKRRAGDCLCSDPITLGRYGWVIRMRMVTPDDIKTLGTGKPIGTEIVARIKIKAIAARMRIVTFRQRHLARPAVLDREDGNDLADIVGETPQQQTDTLVGVGLLGVSRNFHRGSVGDVQHIPVFVLLRA